MGKGRWLALESRHGQVVAHGSRECDLGNRDVWARWRWTGTVLEVRNCDLGFTPLFYRVVPNGIRVADNPLGTLEPLEQAVLDCRALSVFLRLGFFVGEDTPFLGVRQLPPSATLTWSADRGMQLSTGERAAGVPLHVGRANAQKAYAELFRSAIRDTLPVSRPLYLPVSGGRDSRHIALALHEAGVRPDAFVTGYRVLCAAPAEDIRVAAMLAGTLGVRHIVVRQPRCLARAICHAIEETGFCSDEGAWLGPLLDFLRGQGGTVYDGIAGDVMSAGLFQTPELHALLVRGDRHGAADLVLQSWLPGTGGWEGLLDQDLQDALSRKIALEVIAEEMARHVDHPNPARSFYFWNRTRREIALIPFKALSELRVETPYLNRELWGFLDGLPYAVVADRDFHTAVIQTAYPTYADLPFENKDAAQPLPRFDRLLFAMKFLRHTMLRRTRRVDRLRIARRWIGLLRNDPWWSPTMALYLIALLARRPH
jgi:asparagine synthase (glutamine-hydrolysing)